MRRAVLVVLGVLAAATLLAQEATTPPKGWTRALSSDQKHYVWSNLDLDGQGSELAFYTDGWTIRIHTKDSLLDMADVDDGKLTVALLSKKADRVSVDAVLGRDQQSVEVKDHSITLRNWLLEKENIGQEFTLLLAGNGQRMTRRFLNVNTTTEKTALMLDDPPRPNRAKKR